MNLSLLEIAKILNTNFDFSEDKLINRIKIDSRKIEEDDIFVAIKGESFDGHDFVNQAFKNGAIAAIVEKDVEFEDKSKFIIKVDNTIKAMQQIAEFYRSKFDLKVIGITGSVGKSTVKEMIYSIFSTKFNVVKTEGNQNGQIGLPLSVFSITNDHQIAVFEMGVSKIGEMGTLAKIAKPDFAVINNIGTSHIGNFGDIDTIVREKSDISKFSNCKIFANGDNPNLVNYLSNKDNVIYFGFSKKFPYNVESMSSIGEDTEFILVTESYKANIRIPCMGVHNVYNALASIAVASEFGIHINDIKNGIKNFESLPMRQNIIKLDKFTLIDDSYNANYDSVRASIGVLKSIDSHGKNILVIADILELGNYSQEIHFELGKYIASSEIDVLITIGNYSKNIEQGVLSTGIHLESKHFESNQDAFEYTCEILEDGDKVLVKGSRGMKTDEIVQKLLDKFGNHEKS